LGNTLSTNGNWYRKDRNRDSIKVRHYKTKACKHCPALNQCTKNTKGRGRVIERTEFAQYYETNRKNVEEKELLYKRRQAIVEHPFGIMKRQWGFYYISTKKGMNRASADVGLIFLAFNLKRLLNIIGGENMKKWLKERIFSLSELCRRIILPNYFMTLNRWLLISRAPQAT
jgi:hypothetical protein